MQSLQKGLEAREKGHEGAPVGRLFYLALPPTVYPQASSWRLSPMCHIDTVPTSCELAGCLAPMCGELVNLEAPLCVSGLCKTRTARPGILKICVIMSGQGTYDHANRTCWHLLCWKFPVIPGTHIFQCTCIGVCRDQEELHRNEF